MLKLKYKVIEELSEEGVKQLFINHWYGVYKKYILICAGIGFGWLIAAGIIFENATLRFWATSIPIVIIVCFWMYLPIVKAKKWWARIKNYEQPIDIDKVL
jgi:hypothetical protein